MGWWKIDPATGKPSEDGHSKLSREDFILLNAVPGVDVEAGSHYLGDGPWDFAFTTANQIRSLIVDVTGITPEQWRDLLLNRRLPSSWKSASFADGLLSEVDALWSDMDAIYEEDWERPARPAERRWIAEYAVRKLCGDSSHS